MPTVPAPTVLITGAAGRIGRELRPRLARPGRTLRLLDEVDCGPAGAAEEVLVGSVTDPALVARACAGAHAVVHLAGIPGEAPWADLLHVNVHGTQAVLDAAVTAGAPRVVLASSNHAVGMTPLPERGLIPATVPPRPDTFYGASKAALEALGALYADRQGLDVSSLRIGTCSPAPESVRELSSWLSFDDCARLVEACLAAPGPPAHRLLWGVSANTRGFASLAEGEAIGYHPQDDAEAYADRVGGEPEPLVGGEFTRAPLGEPT